MLLKEFCPCVFAIIICESDLYWSGYYITFEKSSSVWASASAVSGTQSTPLSTFSPLSCSICSFALSRRALISLIATSFSAICASSSGMVATYIFKAPISYLSSITVLFVFSRSFVVIACLIISSLRSFLASLVCSFWCTISSSFFWRVALSLPISSSCRFIFYFKSSISSRSSKTNSCLLTIVLRRSS